MMRMELCLNTRPFTSAPGKGGMKGVKDAGIQVPEFQCSGEQNRLRGLFRMPGEEGLKSSSLTVPCW